MVYKTAMLRNGGRNEDLEFNDLYFLICLQEKRCVRKCKPPYTSDQPHNENSEGILLVAVVTVLSWQQYWQWQCDDSASASSVLPSSSEFDWYAASSEMETNLKRCWCPASPKRHKSIPTRPCCLPQQTYIFGLLFNAYTNGNIFEPAEGGCTVSLPHDLFLYL